VVGLILEHNHTLQLPQISHLMAFQRKISELQGLKISELTVHETFCRLVPPAITYVTTDNVAA
jgi:hypothetical protein